MKLHIHPLTLCRTAAFSYADDLATILSELKEAIRESSPEFYELIKDLQADGLDSLDTKLRFSLWKYANRARYRATPYGRFAAVTPVGIGKLAHACGVCLSTQPILHRWPDWTLKEKQDILNLGAVQSLRSNGSFYRCADELRYLFNTGKGFEMAAVEFNPLLEQLLTECQHPCPKATVLQQLIVLFGYEEAEAADTLRWLLEEQLLFTDRQPNITGEDYFERVGYVPEAGGKDYVIPERKLISGSLDAGLLKHLTEATAFLARWLPAAKATNLENFARAFSRRFEQREIPLMEALDPELGVGYAELETVAGTDELIAGIKSGRTAKGDEPKISYGTLQRFLLAQMLDSKKAAPIRLETLTAEPPIKAPQLANTLSALLRPSDDLLVLDNLGGSTCNSLLGRFTKLGGVLETGARELVALEQLVNPDVLFFDIAYLSENTVDNVNRRPRLYAYELPLLCWSTAEEPLSLNDIRVSVRGDEVILRSVRLNKRLVPRLASAYNYTRSDLSVFRFLCDLQGQGLQTNLAIRLDREFPGLDVYPRLQYKDIVLSPAKWKLPERFCKAKASPESLLPELQGWLSKTGIQQPFKCGNSDQTLCFDPANKEDLLALLTYARQQKEVYLEEALLPKESVVVDEAGRPYAAEWLLSLWHGERVYEGHNDERHPGIGRDASNKVYIPGQNWLYYEIYVHSVRANELLLNVIAPFIQQHEDNLRNWFFIRYNEGGNHIRLRLKLKDKQHGYAIMATLAERLEPWLENGILSDLQLRTYRPELERYAHAGMETVEAGFGADSMYLLRLLSKQLPASLLYREAAIFLSKLMEGLGYDLPQQLSTASRQATYFGQEMNLDTTGFKKLNAAYKSWLQEIGPIPPMGTQLGQYRDAAIAAHLQSLQQCPEARRPQLLTDLFHMHVNRLFPDDQRVHELVIYTYLEKELKMKNAKRSMD